MFELRPVIAITAGRTDVPITEGSLDAFYVGAGYARAVADTGGVPLIACAPDGHAETLAAGLLGMVDGIVLSGGNDIAPETYGAEHGDVDKIDLERDRFEVALVQGARRRRIPVLGICRGMELINVAYGGTLRSGVRHEDAPDADLPGLRDARAHPIELVAGSRTAAAFGVEQVEAICLHHQAPDRIGTGLRVTGSSADGVAEALEDPEGWIVGVLWHPEQALQRTPLQRRLYESLVEAARERMSGSSAGGRP